MSLDHMKRLALTYLLCMVAAFAATYLGKDVEKSTPVRYIRNFGVSLAFVAIDGLDIFRPIDQTRNRKT